MPETEQPCIDDQIKVILSQIAEGMISAARNNPQGINQPLSQIMSGYPEFDVEAGMKLYKPVFWYLIGKDGPIACGNDGQSSIWHLKDPKATFDNGYCRSVAEAIFNSDRSYLLCNYYGVQRVEDIPKQ